MQPRATKLLIGIGNILKRDDGVGVRAAEIMSRLSLPSCVEIYDAGTGGLDLPAVIENRDLVIVIDSIDADSTPGTFFSLRPDDLQPCLRTTTSLHDFHLLDALEETRLLGTPPSHVKIFAIQVDDVSTGMGLSSAVAEALLRTIELAVQALGLPKTILNHARLGSAWMN